MRLVKMAYKIIYLLSIYNNDIIILFVVCIAACLMIKISRGFIAPVLDIYNCLNVNITNTI